MTVRRITAILFLLASAITTSAQTSISNEVLGFSRISQDPVYTGMALAGRASTLSPAWSSSVNAAAIPFYSSYADFGASYQH